MGRGATLCGPCGSGLLLATTRLTETKSKQRNDNDDCYLILETTGTW